jgi:hypothetical protein
MSLAHPNDVAARELIAEFESVEGYYAPLAAQYAGMLRLRMTSGGRGAGGGGGTRKVMTSRAGPTQFEMRKARLSGEGGSTGVGCSFVHSFTTTTTSPADANWRRRHTASANDVDDRRSRASNPYIGDPYALSAVNLDDDGHMGDTYSNPSPANPVLKTGVKGKRGMPAAGL